MTEAVVTHGHDPLFFGRYFRKGPAGGECVVIERPRADYWFIG